MKATRARSHAVSSDVALLARGVSLTFIGSASSAVLGFVLTLVLTRGLEAQGAGAFFISTAVFAILGTICTLGADLGCVKMISRDKALDRTRFFRATVLVATVPAAALASTSSLLVLVFSTDVAHVVVRGEGNEAVDSMIKVLMPFLPLAVTASVLLAATRGFGTMVPYLATEQLAKPVLRLAVAAPIALGLGSSIVALAWVVPEALGFVAATIWLASLLRVKSSEEGAGRVRVWRVALEFWRFSLVRGVASLCQVLIRWLDVILVGSLASARAAGVYAAVTRLVVMGALVQRSLIIAIGPQLSALLTLNERRRAQALYRTSTTWLVVVSFPIYIVLAVFSSTIVRIFGDDFSPGAAPLSILALAMLVNMATGPATTILLMAGKASWTLWNAAGSLLINVTLNVLLIPQFGITGAALAWAASILFQNLLPTFQIFRSLRIHPLSSGLIVAAVAALVAFGSVGIVSRFLLSGSAAITGALVVVAGACYGSVLWRHRTRFEFAALRDAMRVRRKRVRVLPQTL